jgi:hypothetical protein
MQLWLQGYTGANVSRYTGDGRLHIVYQGRLIKVMRSEIDSYLDDWAWSVIDLWHRWKMFVMFPFAGGWADQPAHMVEAIETAEAAYKEAQKHDSRRA